MTKADSNRVSLAYAPEATFATLPGTGWKALRFSSESLKQNTGHQVSTEIRSDRQIPDVIRTDIGAAGTVAGELSYDAWDDWLEYSLLSAGWSSPVSVLNAASATIAAAGNTITIGTGAWANTPTVGEWIHVATPTQNFKAKVAAATTTVITVKQTDLLVDETAAMTINTLAQITNGTTLTTMALERQYNDLTNKFVHYLGMAVNGFTLEGANGDLFKPSFDLIGKSEVSAASTDGSATAAPTNDVMSAVDHLQYLWEGTTAKTALGCGFTVANNLRQRFAMGTLGATDIGTGVAAVTGSLQVYLEDETLLDKYLNQTESWLAFEVADEVSSQGNSYIFDFPRIKFTDGGRSAGRQNQDIIADLTWQAIRHATEDATIRICKLASS